MRDKHQVTEEPCESKGSCTVLKSNGSREGVVDFTISQRLDGASYIFTGNFTKPGLILVVLLSEVVEQAEICR